MNSRQDLELERLELKIALLLRWGVMVSAFCLALGWVLHIATAHGDTFARYRDYQTLSLAKDLPAFAEGPGVWISLVGLVVLISLPLLRVAATGFLFFRQGERKLGAIAVFVFLVIVNQASMVSGFVTPQMKIQSFKMLFVCDDCGTEDTLTAVRGKDYEYPQGAEKARISLPENLNCPKCGKGKLEPDFMPEKTFKFLTGV